MMARISCLVATAAAIVALSNGAVVDLPEGEFYKPSGDEVSGFVNATTTYTRSPCPALNSMANYGYIPRDGKNLTQALIKAALMEWFNLDDSISTTMSSQAPTGTFTLADLSKHNLIEHDVSFNRADSYLGADPSFVTPEYMQEMLALAKPSLTLEKTAWLRARRLATCEAENPNCEYGPSQQLTANFQSALMLRVLGGKNTEEISYEYVDAFFNKETFPADYKKPSPAVTLIDVLGTSTSVGNLNTTGLNFDVSTNSTGSGSGSLANSSAPSPAPSSAASSSAMTLAAASVLLAALVSVI